MIITQTPLRISFVGGGTDLKCFYKNHGGAIVNAAIDKYIYVMVRNRLLDHPKEDTVFERESKKMIGIDDVEIFIFSDLPGETGLGSSGSLLVGLLYALHAYKGDKIYKRELAEEACAIEMDILDLPVGKQDQYIATYGGLKYWEFKKCGLVIYENIISSKQIKILNEKLMLFYLGTTRKSSLILKQQVKNVEKITPHLITVRNLANSLRDWHYFNDFGDIMDKGWEEKKHFASNITTLEIDKLYKQAIKYGAKGGKIVGAGGGGFLILYASEYEQDNIRKALNLTEVKFNIVNKGSKIIYGHNNIN